MNGLPIRIESLDVSYGDVPVLHGIDLAVAPGEFIALLGASGCGKTTLLRALAGFIPVAAGRIEVGGEPVGRCCAPSRASSPSPPAGSRSAGSRSERSRPSGGTWR